MKRAARCFPIIAFLLNSLPVVFTTCVTENRFEALQRAEDSSWYAPTIFNSSASGCECGDKFTCVRKCCDVGYAFSENFTCIFSNKADLKVDIYRYRKVLVENPLEVRFLPGIVPCRNKTEYTVHTETDIFNGYLQNDGRLWMAIMDIFFGFDKYCVDKSENGKRVAVYCAPVAEIHESDVQNQIAAIGMVISLPFLLVTFVVYAVLPLRNLHGKALMCYVFSLFTAYFVVVLITYYPFGTNLSAAGCIIIAMMFYGFFVASFFWMNVMCIDIYLTFSGARGFPGSRNKTERKRFLIYSAYAWGAPLALVALVLIVSFCSKPHTWYNPGVAELQCWLNDGIPTLIYMYIPMAALIVANIVLFAVTALRIRQAQQDTAMLRSEDSKTSRGEDEQLRFCVYLKLFLAMGVNWSMDVIFWAIRWQVENVPHAWGYLTEFCNAAFGVFIFFIFVVNKKTWKLLKTRYYQMRG